MNKLNNQEFWIQILSNFIQYFKEIGLTPILVLSVVSLIQIKLKMSWNDLSQIYYKNFYIINETADWESFGLTHKCGCCGGQIQRKRCKRKLKDKRDCENAKIGKSLILGKFLHFLVFLFLQFFDLEKLGNRNFFLTTSDGKCAFWLGHFL